MHQVENTNCENPPVWFHFRALKARLSTFHFDWFELPVFYLFCLAAFDFPQGRSYMDELMFYGTDNETVEELFNGDKFNEAQAISNFVQNGEGSLS